MICLWPEEDPMVAEIFQAQVEGTFSALNLVDSHVDSLSGRIKEILLTSAEKLFECSKMKKQS